MVSIGFNPFPASVFFSLLKTSVIPSFAWLASLEDPICFSALSKSSKTSSRSTITSLPAVCINSSLSFRLLFLKFSNSATLRIYLSFISPNSWRSVSISGSFVTGSFRCVVPLRFSSAFIPNSPSSGCCIFACSWASFISFWRIFSKIDCKGKVVNNTANAVFKDKLTG